MLKAILLDVDGTLIDSNEAHARAWMEALNEAGIPADYLSIREKIGKGGDHLLPELTGIESESELGRQLSQRRGEIFRQDFLPRLRAFPGARALLEVFRNQGFRLVVATSAPMDDLRGLLKQGRLDDLIDLKTSADDADHSKPSPDIVEAALRKAGVDPESALMLGDTPYDIQAASRAGVRSVAFTCGGWSRVQLREAMAIYEGPWDLLAQWGRSPFAASRAAA